MTGQPVTSDSISKTLITAILLTGSAKRAERAMLEGIESLDIAAAPGEELVRRTVAAAIETGKRYPQQPSEEVEEASSMLPAELRPVLHLSPDLRGCYVLRILAAMPREACARLLQLGVSQVDQATCLAVLALARVAERAKKRRAAH